MICCSLLHILLAADFPICTAQYFQAGPAVLFAENQYYVFWEDERYFFDDSSRATYVARVTTNGTVIDPDGIVLYSDSTGYRPAVSYDGQNFLLVTRNHC